MAKKPEFTYKEREVFQQGDILYIRVDAKIPKDFAMEHAGELIPADARGRRVVAYGEKTGHHHAVIDEVQMYPIDAQANEFLMVADRPIRVGHEEHSLKNKIAAAGSFAALTADDVAYIEGILEIKNPQKMPFDKLVEKVPHEIVLPKGVYITRQVVEHDHDKARTRRVVD